MTRSNFIILTLIVLVNLIAWTWAPDNHSKQEHPAFQRVKGLAYSPFRPGQSPLTGIYPTPDQIDQDMQLLSGKTAAISTYGATKGLEAIPGLALKHHLHVTVCAWIDDDLANNELEIQSAIKLANTYSNVNALLIGNEAVLRADHAEPGKGDRVARQIIQYMTRAREQVRVPVSCAESYDVFVRHPDLARQCDFLSAHFLPYWEGLSIDSAAAAVVDQYDYLQAEFPDKRIVMSEVGWPSAGDFRISSVPCRWNQECFVRRFLAAAGRNHLDYFICEAFDQPWKAGEGDVGRYWGLWDADRHAKFDWNQPTKASVPWQWQWAISTLLGLGLIGWFVRSRTDIEPEGHLLFGLIVQACISIFTYTGLAPTMAWLTVGAKSAWVFLFPTQVFMLAIVVMQAFEMTELLWLKKWSRGFAPFPIAGAAAAARGHTTPKFPSTCLAAMSRRPW